MWNSIKTFGGIMAPSASKSLSVTIEPPSMDGWISGVIEPIRCRFFSLSLASGGIVRRAGVF